MIDWRAVGEFIAAVGVPGAIAFYLLIRLDATLRQMSKDYVTALKELTDATRKMNSDVVAGMKDVSERIHGHEEKEVARDKIVADALLEIKEALADVVPKPRATRRRATRN